MKFDLKKVAKVLYELINLGLLSVVLFFSISIKLAYEKTLKQETSITNVEKNEIETRISTEIKEQRDNVETTNEVINKIISYSFTEGDKQKLLNSYLDVIARDEKTIDIYQTQINFFENDMVDNLKSEEFNSLLDTNLYLEIRHLENKISELQEEINIYHGRIEKIFGLKVGQ